MARQSGTVLPQAGLEATKAPETRPALTKAESCGPKKILCSPTTQHRSAVTPVQFIHSHQARNLLSQSLELPVTVLSYKTTRTHKALTRSESRWPRSRSGTWSTCQAECTGQYGLLVPSLANQVALPESSSPPNMRAEVRITEMSTDEPTSRHLFQALGFSSR